jgi:hypothetical protein
MLKERFPRGDFWRRINFTPEDPIKYLGFIDIVANLNSLDASKQEFEEALPIIEKNMGAITRAVISPARIFNNSPAFYENLCLKGDDLVAQCCDICKTVEKRIIEAQAELTDKELTELFIPIMNGLEDLSSAAVMPG